MKSLKKFLKETLPVVFGVLLALFLSNWKEDIDSDRYIEEYYLHINEESESNLVTLRDIVKSHRELLDTLNNYKETDVNLDEILSKVGGIQFALLQNSSWKYFQSNNIGKIDFEVISALSFMERMEYFCDYTAERFIETIHKFEKSNRLDDKEVIIRHLEELIDKEESSIQIFESYKLWFEEHEKE
jgi:hypothetical protein